MSIYIAVDGSEALAHHGAKGMKWGIRNDRDRVASLNRKSSKLSGRIAKNEARAKRFSGNALGRLTIGDASRGNATRLKVVKKNVDAKSRYMSNRNESNRQTLQSARKERIVRNVVHPSLGESVRSRGQWDRQRDAGYSTTKNVIATGATIAVGTAALSAANTLIKRAMS